MQRRAARAARHLGGDHEFEDRGPPEDWTALIWLRIPKLVRFAKADPIVVMVLYYLYLPDAPPRP
jgi:hypothetical protein